MLHGQNILDFTAPSELKEQHMKMNQTQLMRQGQKGAGTRIRGGQLKGCFSRSGCWN
jgi:hypothetical protein